MIIGTISPSLRMISTALGRSRSTFSGSTCPALRTVEIDAVEADLFGHRRRLGHVGPLEVLGEDADLERAARWVLLRLAETRRMQRSRPAILFGKTDGLGICFTFISELRAGNRGRIKSI